MIKLSFSVLIRRDIAIQDVNRLKLDESGLSWGRTT
jgi:hypothetical protein